jgi:ubiquinone/menaquinone biosynthesis C-methylase UbiE
MNHSPDVHSPIDLRSLKDASEWASTAMEKRPWRVEFFDVFASEIARHSEKAGVLELGSGPGFLAAHLLAQLPQLNLHLLDFSEAMHSLARERLGKKASSVKYIVRSFREPDWSADLQSFDCVITNQAVHELRHKRHAIGLHRAVRALLKPEGSYLACDHYVGGDGMRNDQLYMTIQEQQAALLEAGFSRVDQLLAKGGLVLNRAMV